MSSRISVASACFCLVALGAVACKPKPGTPLVEDHTELGLTREKFEMVEDFGRRLCENLTSGEDAPVREAWDVTALWDRIVARVPVDPRFQDQARQSFLNAISNEYGTAVRGLMGSRIEMLKAHSVEGELRLRCRQLQDGGVNYFDFVTAFGAEGIPKVVDAYDFGAGEYVSAGLRRSIIPQLATLAGVSAADLMGGPEAMEAMDAALRLEGALRSGNLKEAGELYLALPEASQKDKRTLLHVLGAVAAGQEGNTPSPEAVALAEKQVAAHFKGDPAFLLLEIDRRFRSGDYDKVLATISELEETVGDDPYLEAMRASALLAADRLEPAVETAMQAVDKAPKLPEAGWAAVNAGMKASRWDSVTKGLDCVVATGVRFDPAEEVMLRPFFKSEEGQVWVRKNASLLSEDPVAPAASPAPTQPPASPTVPAADQPASQP